MRRMHIHSAQQLQSQYASLALRVALFATVSLAWLPGAIAQDGPNTMSLSVEQAIRLALAQNRGVKMKNEDVVHSRAVKDKQRAGYLPKISNLSRATHLTDLEGVVIPSGALGSPATGPIPANTIVLDQGATNAFTSGTHLVQPVTDLLGVHALNSAAQANLESAQFNVNDSEESLAIDVRKVFYNIQVTIKQQAAADAAEKALREMLRESAVQNGQGSSLNEEDISNRSELLQEQQDVLKLRLQMHQCFLQLADLLGVPLNTHFVPLDSPTLLAAPLPTREEAIRLAMQHYPKVEIAVSAVTMARAELHAAEDAYIPHIDALASYEYQSGVPFLVHNFGVFGVQFSYDLFTGGAREATIRDARAELRKAQIDLDEVRDEATIGVEEAYDALEQATQAVAVAEQVMQARSEAARVAEANFNNGAELASKLDSAQANLLKSQAAALEANLELARSQSEVLIALGEIAQ